MTEDEYTQELAVWVEGTTIVIQGDRGGMAKVDGKNGLWLLQKLAKKVRSVQ